MKKVTYNNFGFKTIDEINAVLDFIKQADDSVYFVKSGSEFKDVVLVKTDTTEEYETIKDYVECNSGLISFWSNRQSVKSEGEDYDLIDEEIEKLDYTTTRNITNIKIKNFILIPVYIYEHSGIRLSSEPFSCSWDSGLYGIFLINKKHSDYRIFNKRSVYSYIKYLSAAYEGSLLELDIMSKDFKEIIYEQYSGYTSIHSMYKKKGLSENYSKNEAMSLVESFKAKYILSRLKDLSLIIEDIDLEFRNLSLDTTYKYNSKDFKKTINKIIYSNISFLPKNLQNIIKSAINVEVEIEVVAEDLKLNLIYDLEDIKKILKKRSWYPESYIIFDNNFKKLNKKIKDLKLNVEVDNDTTRSLAREIFKDNLDYLKKLYYTKDRTQLQADDFKKEILISALNKENI
jgi:hypothetical protein